MTRPGSDDAAGRPGHSWPLPARSLTPLAWVTAPAKLLDTETPRGLRVSGTILRLDGSDSPAPPPSAPFPPSAPPLRLAHRPAAGPTLPGRAPSRCSPTPHPSPTRTSRHPALPVRSGGSGVGGSVGAASPSLQPQSWDEGTGAERAPERHRSRATAGGKQATEQFALARPPLLLSPYSHRKKVSKKYTNL